MIDKFKSCKDCPDRSVEPNCHNTCEGYLARCEKSKKIREQKDAYFKVLNYEQERLTRLSKRDKSRWRR